MQAFATTFGLGIFSSPAVIAADLAINGSFHTAYLLVGTAAALTAAFPLWMPSPALVDQPADSPTVAADAAAETTSHQQQQPGVGFEPLPAEEAVAEVHEAALEEQDMCADTAEPLKEGGSGQHERGQRIFGLEAERLVKGLVALIIMCYCGAEASFGAWVPTFAVTTHTLDQVACHMSDCTSPQLPISSCLTAASETDRIFSAPHLA